jgi:hypothetical protein
MDMALPGPVLTVELGSAEELFFAPSPDPTWRRFDTDAGIDRLARQLEAMPRSARVGASVLLRLPDEPPGLREGFDRYCKSVIERLKQQVVIRKREGRKALIVALCILAVAMTISVYFRSAPIPWYLQTILGEGFMIGGWVALWRPIDLLLYDNWPDRERIAIWQGLAAAPIRIQRSSDEPASVVEASAHGLGAVEREPAHHHGR